MKNNLMALSNFCLAFAVVIGSWLIANGLRAHEQPAITQPIHQTSNTLLTESELASYLGLSLEEVKKLGPASDSDSLDVPKRSMLPFLQIGNKVYFSKNAVDKWLTDNQASSVQ